MLIVAVAVSTAPLATLTNSKEKLDKLLLADVITIIGIVVFPPKPRLAALCSVTVVEYVPEGSALE